MLDDKFQYSDVPTNSIVHPSVDLDQCDPEDACEIGLTYSKHDGHIVDTFFDLNGHIVLDDEGIENVLENKAYEKFLGEHDFSYYKKAQEVFDSGKTDVESFWLELSKRLVEEDNWRYLKEEW